MINIDDGSPNLKDEFEFPGEEADAIRRNDPQYKTRKKVSPERIRRREQKLVVKTIRKSAGREVPTGESVLQTID